jgi:hypothetical protein
MTNIHTPGWYGDPTGQHELRYFDGQWSDRVSDNGVVATSPIAAATSAAKATPRLSRGKLIVVAGVFAVGTAVAVFGVSVGGGSGTNVQAFCRDYQTGSLKNVDYTDLAQTATYLSKLAAEAPAAARSDLRLLASDVTAISNGNLASVDTAAADAAGTRIDQIAESTCAGK